MEFQRHTAIKTTIKQILESTSQKDENEVTYSLTTTQERLYRVNVLGTILQRETVGSINNFLVDDGTGKITIRFFEENKILDKMNVGMIILIIGRIRVYNQEKYISPEIVKEIPASWLKVRSLECKKLEDTVEKTEEKIEVEKEEELKKETVDEESIEEEVIDTEVKNVKEVKEMEGKSDTLLPNEKIISLIKELDQGEGVLVEDLIERSHLNNTEQLIEKMLKQGEIFQIMPGKVKVL